MEKTAITTCARCRRRQPDAETFLHCEKCQTAYCSTDCQRADKKKHQKKYCRDGAKDPLPGPSAPKSGGSTTTSQAASSSPTKGLDAPTEMPFARLDRGTYLHDRPQPDVFRLLIDCYRLRMEDNKIFDGIVEPDSIYGGATTGREGFRRFLGHATQRQGLLPGWWDDAAAAACEELGMNTAEDNWYSLSRRVTKASVIEHYGDKFMPMHLRMLGEAVYRRGVGGQDGTAIRKQMAKMERNGDMHMSMFGM